MSSKQKKLDSAESISRFAGVAVTYFLVTEVMVKHFSSLGIGLDNPIIRPNAGFALAMLLLLGTRYWPALFVGALFSNVSHSYSLWGAVLLAGGVSLSAVLGAWLLTREKDFDKTISSFPSFVQLVFWGGLVGSLVVSICGGVASLGDQAVSAGVFWKTSFQWWRGSILGVLVATPLILVWQKPPAHWPQSQTVVGMGLYLLISFLAGQTIFMEWFTSQLGGVALGYWMFLIVGWGTAQFGPHSVVIVIFMSSIQAFWGASMDVGFFEGDMTRSQFSNVWFYLLALSTLGMGLASVVNSLKEAEQKIRQLAFHDSLTGLPNRMLLSDRIAQAIASAKREKLKVAILFHDLDRFKPVNDKLGHRVGDLLLQEVAERVKLSVRQSDTVGRLGGDEFVVVLPAIQDTSDVLQVAQKIHDVLLNTFIIDGHEIHISTSIGIAFFPEHGLNEETLMVNADNAMYRAKRIGRNSILFFSPDMSGEMRAMTATEKNLNQPSPHALSGTGQ